MPLCLTKESLVDLNKQTKNERKSEWKKEDKKQRKKASKERTRKIDKTTETGIKGLKEKMEER